MTEEKEECTLNQKVPKEQISAMQPSQYNFSAKENNRIWLTEENF